MDKYYVYLVTNLVNGKVYVGKSNDPQVRWGDHRKVALGGKEKYPTEFFAIHAAINKYGLHNFKFEILEEFNSEDEAYYFETWWIEFLESHRKSNGYNCNMGGKGGVSPSPETRQKLIIAANRPEKIKLSSDMMKKRHQENPGFLSSVHKGNQYTKGRKLSQQEKDHLSEISKGKIVSDETKIKMSKAQSGNKHSQAKITEKDVLEIRENFSKLTSGKKKFCEDMGVKYNVGSKTIENVVYRLSWSHI